MIPMENETLLGEALQSHGISLSQPIKQQFALYHQLLLDWNQRMILISQKDKGRIYSRHFLESLGLVFAVNFPQQSRIMDLGSGAGLPGIPMKIIRPDLQMVLVESVQKKVSFLKTVLDALGMDNLEVYHGRAETFKDQDLFDFIVSRSVSSLINLSKWSRPLLKPGGRLIAFKGSKVEDDLFKLERASQALKILKWQKII